MGPPFKPGEFVVRRVRWHADANLVGIVLGSSSEDSSDLKNVLVLWTTSDQRIKLRWHAADALMTVDS